MFVFACIFLICLPQWSLSSFKTLQYRRQANIDRKSSENGTKFLRRSGKRQTCRGNCKPTEKRMEAGYGADGTHQVLLFQNLHEMPGTSIPRALKFMLRILQDFSQVIGIRSKSKNHHSTMTLVRSPNTMDERLSQLTLHRKQALS